MNETHEMGSTAEAVARPYKVVYTVVERGDKKYWVRVGAAWINHDQSISVKLDASPTNGTLQIRDPRSQESRFGGERGTLPLLDGARFGGVA